MESNKRRTQRQPEITEDLNHVQKVGARVAFVEKLQNVVIKRLDGADHECAPGIPQGRQKLGLLEQVFNLDRSVVGQLRKFAMKCLYQFDGVCRPIKEVRVAKRNVLRSRLDLLANVSQHNVALHHTKFSFVNRDYGAMAAQVLATAAGLGIPGKLLLAVRQYEFRILGELGKALAARSQKRQPIV